MLSAFLITLREGLEAALVIGIILAYLGRTGNRQAFRPVWLGTSLGIVGSVIAGGAIYVLAGEFSGQAEKIFEGVTLFLAAGVLTWMIFWMRKQAVDIKTHLHAQIKSVLTSKSSLGLVMLAFVAVVREGIEASLFLFAATRVPESAILFTLGGFMGLVGATLIGYTIYKGTSRLKLGTFFNVTSFVLIVFAAGLLAHGFGEFHEAGIIPPLIEHVWDTSHVLARDSTTGQFLATIIGYEDSPSLVQAAAYFTYLVVAAGLYLRRPQR